MNTEIGLALRLARVAVGKSQWQIASRIGIHPSILNRIESGKQMPDGELIQLVIEEIRANAPKSRLITLVLNQADTIAQPMVQPQSAPVKGARYPSQSKTAFVVNPAKRSTTNAASQITVKER